MTSSFLFKIGFTTLDHFLQQPALLLVLALLGALLLGGGRSYGITWLVWAEEPHAQRAVGAAMGLLWSTVLFVALVVDQAAWLLSAGILSEPALINSTLPLDMVCMLLYWFPMLLGTAGALGGAWGVKRLRRWWTPKDKRYPQTVDHHRPLLLGLAGGLVFGLSLALVPAWAFGDRDAAGGVVRGELWVFVFAAFVVYGALSARGSEWRTLNPAVSVCVLLILLVLTYGVLHLMVASVTGETGAVGLVSALIVGLVIAVVVLMGWPRYRIRFPELETAGYYCSARLVDLNNPPVAKAKLLNPVLGESGDLAINWGQKKPLVIVATSGGGVTAAVWTVAVLNALEKVQSQFPYHVRLMTGASGAMVGAGYYVSTLTPPDLPTVSRHQTNGIPLTPDVMFDKIAGDSLSDVVRRFVFHDVPRSPWAWAGRDRGQVLQQAWSRDLDGALDLTFAKLLPDEQAGWRPSLVFAPMMIEDGRRLLAPPQVLELGLRLF